MSNFDARIVILNKVTGNKKVQTQIAQVIWNQNIEVNVNRKSKYKRPY